MVWSCKLIITITTVLIVRIIVIEIIIKHLVKDRILTIMLILTGIYKANFLNLFDYKLTFNQIYLVNYNHKIIPSHNL